MTRQRKRIQFDDFTWDLLLPSNIDSELAQGILWEPVVTRWIKDTLKPGMTAVDVGANFGWFTLQMARCVGPHGKVWSFEPCYDFYERLIGHLAVNRIDNVNFFHEALCDREGTCRIIKNVPPYESSANVTDDPRGDLVGCSPLDKYPLGSCDLIKIDVDGSEWEVLQGAQETIAMFRPALVIEVCKEAKAKECLEFLVDLKYAIRPEEVTPWREINEVLAKLKPARPTVNVIAMPKERT